MGDTEVAPDAVAGGDFYIKAVHPNEVRPRALIESRIKLYFGSETVAAISNATKTSGPTMPARAKMP
jgi:hypothetical protein